MKKGERCDIRATVCRDRNAISLLTNSFFVANLQHLARLRDAHELTCVKVDPALTSKIIIMASPAGLEPATHSLGISCFGVSAVSQTVSRCDRILAFELVY